jgi:ribosomal protein S18 acetylase RimI-like enzyme
VENEEGIEFYKKHGFSVTDTLEDYYKKLTPSQGVVLAKKVPAKK